MTALHAGSAVGREWGTLKCRREKCENFSDCCMAHLVRYGCWLQLMGYFMGKYNSCSSCHTTMYILFCNCILTNIRNGVGHGTGNYSHYGTLYKFSWNDAGVSYIAFGLLILLFIILFIFFSVYTQGELDKARLDKFFGGYL